MERSWDSQHRKAVTKEIVSHQAHTIHLHSCTFFRPHIEQDFSHGISKFTSGEGNHPPSDGIFLSSLLTWQNGRIVSSHFCLFNHFKLHILQRSVGRCRRIRPDFSLSHETAASHVRCTSSGRFYLWQCEVEGRMSRLHLRKRSGKVVLEPR